jgi:hypothetical protein
MSFRDYSQGPSFWAQCLERGVAAITYEALADTNLAGYPRIEATPGWPQLEPGQKGSLKHFVEEMAPGDIIYVREAGQIVGRGVVAGPYYYEAQHPITVVGGGPTQYRHFRRVSWCCFSPGVAIVLGTSPQPTVLKLTPSDVERVERAAGQRGEAD